MPQRCGWSSRFLAVLAAIGVLLAPVESVLHAQSAAPHTMSTPCDAGAHPSHHSPSHQAPHHTSTFCCELCFSGCSCATGPAVLIEYCAVPLLLDGGAFITVLMAQLPPPRLAPHPNTFALPPPSSPSA